jgi:agmatine deiminase
MKAILFLILLAVSMTSWAEISICGTEELLPIGFTAGELQRLDEIGVNTLATAPPPAGVRNPGEFEPATGVFVRWPLGVPYDFLIHVSNNSSLWVIVSSSEQAAASSALTSAGVNMSNTDYLIAPTNSIWVRDYGPWFIVHADGTQGIFNYTYNRPRPLDNNIPIEVGSAWGIPVYTSTIVHTGGNYMSGGLGQSMSTTMVYDENGGNVAWVNGEMEDYLGVTDYFTMDDPQSSYIDHIDCWAKVLSPDRVMILQVPPSHPDYTSLEAAADLFSNHDSPYGTKWEVYRVYSSGTEGYTNGLLHNDIYYLPVWNTGNDTPAVISYENALPGYTVETVYFSGFSNTDALHCRSRNVMDRYMLWIDHVPVDALQGTAPVTVDALIKCHPSNSLTSHDLHYRVGTSGPFTQIAMNSTGGNGYTANVPGQPEGSDVQYYISATDDSGRSAAHPQYAPDTWFNEYTVSSTGIGGSTESGPGVWISSPSPNPFASSVTVNVSLVAATPVTLRVWDVSGRLVESLDDVETTAGTNSVTWTPGTSIPDGLYLLGIAAGDSFLTVRVIRSSR